MIRKLLSNHYLIGALTVVAIALMVSIANYEPGTFLSGWDTLHPEFDLGLYAQRVLFGAWQEHQGLGAPASQAHLAELPRLPILWLLTHILPMSAVRYAFFFLMYILGGLGTYIFIRNCWFERQSGVKYTIAAVLGAVFYLLNLGTLQHFYVPLEMFAVHFGTLGLVLFTLYKAIKYPNAKHFFLFFIVQFFSAPSAHTATLFYMYMIVVFLYAAALALSTYGKNLKASFKVLFALSALTLLAHSYWIIPNLYYVAAHSEYVQEAKISRLFSNEAFWQNQAFGKLSDVLISKNFLFNWKDYNHAAGKFFDLFDEWELHLTSNYGYALYFILGISSLAGIPILVTGNKNKKLEQLSLLVLIILPCFFLVNLNFPFTSLFGLLRENSSLFEESLRFPFTKFSMLWIFSLSVLLSHFLSWSLQFFGTLSLKQNKVFSLAFITFFSFCILYAGLPALKGNLVSDSMKVPYPAYYQELFTWSKSQPEQTRIVKFPVTSFWGWNYYDWQPRGYQGAGFTWFGLKQPTMDREFDRWASTNEFFYHELAEAIRTEDQELFNTLLSKYHISWLLYDHSVFDPQRLNQEAYFNQFSRLISGNSNIQLSKQIGEIQLYSVQTSTQPTFVTTKEVDTIDATTAYVRRDQVYKLHGDYINHQSNSRVFPFAHVLAERLPEVAVESSSIHFSHEVTETGKLHIPDWESANKRVPVTITSTYDEEIESLILQFNANLPQLLLNDEVIFPTNRGETVSMVIPIVESELYVAEINGELISLSTNQSQPILGDVLLSLESDTPIRLYQAEFAEDGALFIPRDATAVEFITSDSLQPLAPTYAPIALNKGDILKLEFTQVPQITTLPDFNTSSIENCNLNTGEAHVTNQNDSYIFTSTNKANACHRFTFDHLLADVEYVMVVEASNEQGMPLKFNLNEKDQVQPYLEEMINQKQSSYTYSMLGNRTQNGVDLHLSSLSFGSIETKNILEDVRFIPTPLTWISNFTITTEYHQTIPPVQNVRSKKLNNTLYTATVSSPSEQAAINLEQTYDEGWVAFSTQNPLSLLPHYRLNGWANTWIVPSGNHNIVIFFLPQVATWIGLWLAGSTLVWFIVALTKK